MEAAFEGLDLEALDPTPDVHSLFMHYNALYFDNALGACSVEWSSKRMTRCAGMCYFQNGGGCRIKLSEPLLKFRPTSDLKATLLHEMIHALLFLNHVRDDGDHGPKFRAVMHRINASTVPDPMRPPGGYNVDVYHTMHDEVNSYRTHVWKCTQCGNLVRRAMNRPPQEADCRSYSKAAAAAAPGGAYCRDSRCWYHGHIRTCGGAYEKIAEPEKQPSPSKPSSSSGGASKHPTNAANKRRQAAAAGAAPITSYFAKRDDSGQPSSQQQQQQQGQGQQQDQRQGQQQGQQKVGGAGGGSSSQSQLTGVLRPSLLDPRAAAAAAALARAAGGGNTNSGSGGAAGGGLGGARTGSSSQQQQQQQQQRPLQSVSQQQQRQQQGLGRSGQQQPDVVELLSSDDEVEEAQEDEDEAAPWSRQQRSRTGRQQQQTAAAAAAAQAGGVFAAAAGGGVAAAAGGGGGGPGSVLMCPVCCLEFQELGALNAHLDQCLGLL